MMDPTLLHQSQPPSFDFTDKYFGQPRSFSNSAYSANDFSLTNRRPQVTLTSSTPGVALPTNPGLDFNGNSLLGETPYHHSSQLLLSPPDSQAGSASTSGNLTTSLSAYTTLPKPFPSNACPPDHFASAPSSVLSSNWLGPPMTSMDRISRVSPLSPPHAGHSYSTANGIAPPFRTMDNRLSHYSNTLPPQISPSSFPPRYPPNPYLPRANGHFPLSPEPHYPGHSMSPDNQSCAGRDGPPFNETQVHHQVLTLRGQNLMPEIKANIQKGFFQVERKWTCYRRNYFAVQCTFNFRNSMTEGPFYLNKNGSDELIQQFAVSISAKTAATTNGESEARGLVQHTPKRDKATESIPRRQPITPSTNHTMTTGGTYSSSGHIYHSANHLHSVNMGGFGFEAAGGNSPPSNQITFERIQFQKATANNGKRRAQQQYFLVVVELSANIGRQGNEDWVVIATQDSEPMVVRGRSPGHYKDNGRRDSQASMDPDCGAGHGAGGHTGPVSSGNLGPGHNSVDWSTYRQQNGHFGGYTYRHAVSSRDSPTSMVSANILVDTTPDAEPSLSLCRTARSSGTLSSETSAFTPLSDSSDDILFSSLDRDNASRKRSFDNNEDGEHLRFPLAGPFAENISSLANFSAIPSSKLLCASS